MWLRTGLMAAGLLTLTACKLEIPTTGNETVSMGELSVEMTEFERNGGPQCPGSAGVTTENAQCASVKITYPKVLGTTVPKTVEAINQFIQEQLLDFSDEEGKQPATLDELANLFIGDYLKNPSQSGVWELERKVEPVFGKDTLVTFVFTENGYTGGAHPFSGQRYFVLSSQTGQQLTLADLLTPGYEASLNVAGERAFREARGIAPNISLEDSGFSFENNTFRVNTNFSVGENGLTFIFNPYEVGPYALGPTEFTVPYDDISSLIPANSPLAAVAQ